MRICVIAPSTKYRVKSAGARIRYLRIEPVLRALGHSLEILSIDQFVQPLVLRADVYLFSKCYDVRGVALARMLRREGAVVGVDFFDDHFSQVEDSRLIHRREWLADMASLTDFALCSTSMMATVVASRWPDHPRHVMNDPFGEFDALRLADTLEAKLAHARSSRTLRIGWFGQGDNNHFPVGLRDVVGFGHTLSELKSRFDVQLEILTNLRALHADGLERIQSLPIPINVREWSEPREKSLLANCPVAFIPVNAQPFSAAKSLNRAVSALTSGCQVLTNGYPLYAPFSDFIYDNPAALSEALDVGKPALRRETVAALLTTMTDIGDPAVEAARLSNFLVGVLMSCPKRPRDQSEIRQGVLHGRESLHNAHAVTQRLGFLSIASPFAAEGPAYDVVFQRNHDGSVSAELSQAALSWLAPGLAAFACLRPPGADAPRFSLDLTDIFPPMVTCKIVEPRPYTAALTAARYAAAMAAARSACKRLFPGIELILSEADPTLAEWPDEEIAG